MLTFVCSRAQVFLAIDLLEVRDARFFCEASRALTEVRDRKWSASKPMIATTIMISTRVNALRVMC
jgi:transposase-like protein